VKREVYDKRSQLPLINQRPKPTTKPLSKNPTAKAKTSKSQLRKKLKKPRRKRRKSKTSWFSRNSTIIKESIRKLAGRNRV